MSPESPFTDPAAQGELPPAGEIDTGEIGLAQLEAWMDRLVDGEVAEPERRALLSRLERMPDGWRRCALAFLEAQAWRSLLLTTLAYLLCSFVVLAVLAVLLGRTILRPLSTLAAHIREIGRTGDLYVAMAAPTSSGIDVLRPDGTRKASLRNPGLDLTAPYDGPANLAFDGSGKALVTNHAPVTGLALRTFSLLEVDLQDKGANLFRPAIP